MNTFFRRTVAVLAVLTTAALVATGCGSSGASNGAGKAASGAKGLEYLPKGTLFYLTFDTDFSGKNWDKVSSLGKRFDGWDKAKGKLDKALEKKNKNGATYNHDVKPWLGKNAGVAVTGVSVGDKDADVVFWLESTDDGKAKSALKDKDTKSEGSYKGYDLYHDTADSSDVWWTVKDGTVLGASSKSALQEAIRAKDSGDNIKDDSTSSDAAKHVDDGAVAAFVMGKSGLKELVKAVRNDKSANPTADALVAKALDSQKKAIDGFKGLEFSFGAADDGFTMDGWFGYDRSALGSDVPKPEDIKPTLLEDMPNGTAAAYTNSDLGGTLKAAVDAFTKADSATATQLSTIEGTLGLSVKDLADAYDGPYAVGVDLSMGAPSVTAAFEANGTKTSETTTKLLGLTQLQTQQAPVTQKVGSVSTTVVDLGTAKIYAGEVNGTELISNTVQPFGNWGQGDTLGDNKEYQDAATAAGVPDKVTALFYLSPQQLAAAAQSGLGQAIAGKVAGAAGASSMSGQDMSGMGKDEMGTMDSGSMGKLTPAQMADLKHLGPWLAWAESSDNEVEFHAFMQILA